MEGKKEKEAACLNEMLKYAARDMVLQPYHVNCIIYTDQGLARCSSVYHCIIAEYMIQGLHLSVCARQGSCADAVPLKGLRRKSEA